jgi:Tol biopolymer transport system component
VSVNDAGAQADIVSTQWADLSGDARYVAFDTFATNLVANDTNGVDDVVLRDLRTGLNERISVNSAGQQGNRGSEAPAMSADARFVAFHSGATNLGGPLSGDPFRVFVRDRLTRQTTLVSFASAAQTWCMNPRISADGRFVAYTCLMRRAPGGPLTFDVWVTDRQSGAIEPVSVNATGVKANESSRSAA